MIMFAQQSGCPCGARVWCAAYGCRGQGSAKAAIYIMRSINSIHVLLSSLLIGLPPVEMGLLGDLAEVLKPVSKGLIEESAHDLRVEG